jgi:2-hydroxy-6-oxo-6-(2'-carboxyphenyl)-hexa-2,4-dienoate hydrolase
MTGNRRAFLKTAAGAATLPLLAAADIPGSAAAQDARDSKMMGAPKFVDVDGIRTRYFDGGSGPTMVLIHGGQWPAATSSYCFAPIFDDLAAHFHLYVFDKLGMGFTDNPKTDADYSMDAITRHADGFIRALGLKNIILGGHSRGALPAARIACDNPGNVTHLICFDSNTLAPDDPNTPDRIDPPMREEPPTREEIHTAAMKSTQTVQKAFLTDSYIDEEYKVAQQPKIRAVDRKFREVRDAWVAAHPDLVAANPLWKRNMGATTWWMYETKYKTLDLIKGGALKMPTLIIWGFNDPTAPYGLGVNLMETVSKVVDTAELHMINRSGHFVFAEHPRRVTQIIVNFTNV